MRAEIVADCSKGTLSKALRAGVDIDSIIHSDGPGAYKGVAALGYKMHKRVHHHREFARGDCHM